MRHGHAPSLGEAGVLKDEERPLSARGHEEAVLMARRLLEKEGAPQMILASPLKRALETAQEASSILRPAKGVRSFDPLSNRLSADTLFMRLREETQGISQVLAVGHQPQLGELVAFLTGRSIDIRPAGVAALKVSQFSGGQGELLWWLNPELPL